MKGFLRVGFNPDEDVRLRAWTSRRRQLYKPVILHAQHSYPTGHVFQSPVRLKPVHGPTGQTRKIGAGASWLFCDQGPDQGQFFFAKIAATITVPSTSLRTGQEVSKGSGCAGKSIFRGCVNSLRRVSAIVQGKKGVKSVGARPPFSAQALR